MRTTYPASAGLKAQRFEVAIDVFGDHLRREAGEEVDLVRQNEMTGAPVRSDPKVGKA